MLFLKTSLWISRPNQNPMKQSDLGKSLDPIVCTYNVRTHKGRQFKAIIFSVVYIPNMYYCTMQKLAKPAPIKKKLNFPHILGNSEGIGCKVIYD
jgi:hypothetical protein